MRIISDFHDYYDPVKSVDADPLPVFVRKMEVKAELEYRPMDYGKPMHFDNRTWHVCHVWVAGQWFRPICLRWVDDFQWAFTVEECDEFVRQRSTKLEWQAYDAEKRKIRGRLYWRLHWWGKISRQAIRDALENPKTPFNPLQYDQPIVAQAYQRIVINCQLKHFDLQRVLDPYTCYQNIRMYIDGVISRPGGCEPPIDDKTLAEAKGFDKWSFRKEKSSK